jgi:hypothetical protein
MIRKLNVRTSLALIVCGLSASCIGRDPPSISSPDPDRLIPAIKTGVREHDRRVIPYLVEDLESDDSAVRMYAIDGLRRLTNQDLGYVYFADDDDRKPAVGRWKQWLAEHASEFSTTQPQQTE